MPASFATRAVALVGTPLRGVRANGRFANDQSNLRDTTLAGIKPAPQLQARAGGCTLRRVGNAIVQPKTQNPKLKTQNSKLKT
jgi:hypothetical protein